MAHDSNRIYAPIDLVSDIYGFFGMSASNTNGNYDVAAGIEFACPRYVNKWARNKPEAIGGPGDLTDAQRKANNFGLTVPTTYTTVANYITAVNNSTLQGWVYNYPRQANGNWFRMDDLNNYRVNSQSPLPTLAQGDLILGQSLSGTKVLNISLAAGYEGTQGNTDYISLADLNKSGACYSDWYAGVLIRKNASIYYLATSDAKVTQSLAVQFNANNGMVVPTEGAYTAYVFIANKSFKVCSAGSTAVSGLQLVPVTTAAVNVTVVTPASSLTVSVAQQGTKVAVTVANMNASQVVITPVEFQLSANNGATYTSASPIEAMSAFTVPAGSSASPSVVTKSFRLPVMNSSYNAIRFVYKQKIGNGAQSVNQFTPWSALIGNVIS